MASYSVETSICAITLFIFLLPGYLIISVFTRYRLSLIEKIFASFVVSCSVSVLFGFLSSMMEMFSPETIFYFFAALTFLILPLYSYKRYKERDGCDLLAFTNLPYSILQITLFLFLSFVAYLFESHDLLPVTHDRSVSFLRTIYLLKNKTTPSLHPGSPYLPFYPQGFNFSVASFCSIYIFLSKVTLDFSEFSLLPELSKPFVFFLEIVIGMYAFGAYTFFKRAVNNEKVANLALLSTLPIMTFGTSLPASGSLSDLLSYCVVAFPLSFLISPSKLKEWKSGDYVPFVLSLIAVSLMSLQPFALIMVTFFAIFSTHLLCNIRNWKETFRTWKPVFLSLLIVSLIAPSLLFGLHNMLIGTMDEIQRKREYANPIGAATSSATGRIIDLLTHLGIFSVFLPLGILKKGEKKEEVLYIYVLLLVSMLFPFLPFPPWHGILKISLYSFALFIGRGLEKSLSFIKKTAHTVLVWKGAKTAKLKKLAYLILIPLLAIPSLALVNISVNPSKSRSYSYVSETAFKLSEWVGDNLKAGTVLVSALDKPKTFILYTFTDIRTFYVNPLSPDIPSTCELAKLYDSVRNWKGYFDYSDVPMEIRAEIITEYNISVILTEKTAIIRNVTSYGELYPDMKFITPLDQSDLRLLVLDPKVLKTEKIENS